MKVNLDSTASLDFFNKYNDKILLKDVSFIKQYSIYSYLFYFGGLDELETAGIINKEATINLKKDAKEAILNEYKTTYLKGKIALDVLKFYEFVKDKNSDQKRRLDYYFLVSTDSENFIINFLGYFDPKSEDVLTKLQGHIMPGSTLLCNNSSIYNDLINELDLKRTDKNVSIKIQNKQDLYVLRDLRRKEKLLESMFIKSDIFCEKLD